MDLWQENMVRDKESHWHVKLPEGFLWANKSWVLRLPLKHMDLLLPQLSSLVWTGHHLEESTFTKKFTIRWLVWQAGVPSEFLRCNEYPSSTHFRFFLIISQYFWRASCLLKGTQTYIHSGSKHLVTLLLSGHGAAVMDLCPTMVAPSQPHRSRRTPFCSRKLFLYDAQGQWPLP